ncbi:acyl-CoA thioesterase [Georgenia sp. TF02-10]|uniref:acyl-CoA thioesterase n=1 Tax=Georgenia sp. TF02-10 TaxID=2917725 RepID=UPI00352D0B88
MTRLTIPVRLRWSDVDGYQHVNNAKMFTILEETRIAAFWASVPGDGAGGAAGGGPDGAAADGAPGAVATGSGDGGPDAAADGDGDGLGAATGSAPEGAPGAAPAAVGSDPVPGTKVLATGPGSGTNTYIARQEIEYLAPLPYTLRPVPVQLWISHLGGASLDVCYEVPGPDRVAARAMTTLVLIDEDSGRPRRMTAEERATWEPYLEDPVRFRRRPGTDV